MISDLTAPYTPTAGLSALTDDAAPYEAEEATEEELMEMDEQDMIDEVDGQQHIDNVNKLRGLLIDMIDSGAALFCPKDQLDSFKEMFTRWSQVNRPDETFMLIAEEDPDGYIMTVETHHS